LADKKIKKQTEKTPKVSVKIEKQQDLEFTKQMATVRKILNHLEKFG
jgi:hypothetical protein